MSEAKGTAIYVDDTQGLLVFTFSSAKKAAKFFNTHHPAINRYAKNNKLFQDKRYLSFSKDFSLENSNKDSSDNNK